VTAFAIGLGIGIALGATAYHFIARAVLAQLGHDDGEGMLS
jgi:hypothetical protein